MIHRSKLTLTFVAALVLTTSAVFACTIPVFRYALDRWQADPYALVIPASLAGDKAVNDLLRPIRANSPGNLEVHVEDDPAFDKPGLFFPSRNQPVWSGDLTAGSLAKVLDSPARQAIVRKILDGVSSVWILVDNGDASTEADAKRIGDRLKFLEQVASLPIQDPNDPDSQLGPGPELKLDFELIRVSRNDPAEAVFIEMLRGPSPNPETAEKPFLSAIFGRGRALGAWTLEEMDNIALEDASMFLSGRCSCQVKQQNPGWDLMLATDWDKALQKVSLKLEAAKEVPAEVSADKPTDKPKGKAKNPAPSKAESKSGPKATPPSTKEGAEPKIQPGDKAPSKPQASEPAAPASTEPVTITTQPASLVKEIPLPKADPLRIGLFSFAGFCLLVVFLKLIRPRPKAVVTPDDKS